MNTIVVEGGKRLKGRYITQGAKNAILPILGGALLCDDPIKLTNVPKLADVRNMLGILEHIGCKYEWREEDLTIYAKDAHNHIMPEDLAKELRSSIFMLGPMIARFKKAKCAFPGGCEIGNRPIDLHIKGLKALNVKITEEYGYIFCDGSDIQAANIHLDYPSVGATENIMMAAIAAKGITTITNAAREPEIYDLQEFLCKMGAKIAGAMSSTIIIEGGTKLRGTEHEILPDRIAAGTFMVAAAMTKGDVLIENIVPGHLNSVLSKLRECGCTLDLKERSVRVRSNERPNEICLIETLPYPGFPTDMQAQFFALAGIAKGTSIIVENVFENRFKHAGELACMGVTSTIKDRMAIIRGSENIRGANVHARDLRCGAALVLAGLFAKGKTTVDNVHFIDRGYECLDKSFMELGAECYRI